QAQAPAPGSRRARRMAERGEGGEAEETESGVYTPTVPAQSANEPADQDGYLDAAEAWDAAGPGEEQQADPYSYDPYAAQQPVPGYADPYAQQYAQEYDPYAGPPPEYGYPPEQYGYQPQEQYEGPGYQGQGHQGRQGYGQEAQPWQPGGPQTHYDPND